MPATSRSVTPGSRRSASGRAGSPSKSSSSQPLGCAQRLAEVQVAVDPLGDHRLRQLANALERGPQ